MAAGRQADVSIDLDPVGPAPVMKGDDGAEMVLVPAREFWMGSAPKQVKELIEGCVGRGTTEATCKGWYERELPRHRIVLDAYYSDRCEVTTALFERFAKATDGRGARR